MSPTREELLQGALDAAANGWHVAPLRPGAKEPNFGRHWDQEGTQDPDEIRRLWAEVPYNIAGLTRRYLVIDVDVRGGKPGADSFARLSETYDMPPTRVHRTPSGGFHQIYECPPDWELSQKINWLKDYPGIDLKAGNPESSAYVVLPPSALPDGDYTVTEDVAPVRAPDWIKELHDGPIRNDRILLSSLPPGTFGTRDNTLTRIAGKLRREGQDEAAIFAVLVEQQSGWARPLPEKDLRRIAHSAMRWAPDPMGGLSQYSTDLDNARLMQRASDDNLRWREDDKRWTVWDGRRWGSDTLRFAYTAEALEVVQQMIDHFANIEGAGKTVKELILKKNDIKSARGNSNLWKMLLHLPGIVRSNEEFDANPYLLNVQNGTVDLRTGDLLPHDKKYLLSRLAPYEFDPEADMSAWVDFVNWCCKGDLEMAHWLKVALGQAAIGKQDEHMLIFMFGEGNNGKSQLSDAILMTLGNGSSGGYGLTSTADLLTAKGKDQLHPEMTASLFGVRLAVCPEPEKGCYWASARVKALTGGDQITARHLYGREFTFEPSHTLVVHGNHKPEIRDLSVGFRRRMRLVPFNNYVKDEDRIPHLGEKLAGPGVLRWLVEGAVEYCRSGMPPSQRVRAETEGYVKEQDQFLRCFDELTYRNEEGHSSISDLYALYQFWAKREGLRFVETKPEMVKWFASNGFVKTKRRAGQPYPRPCIDGIVIQQMDDDPQGAVVP